MPPERNRVLAGERISRAALDAVDDVSDAAIAAAVAALDCERAALLALARAKRGEPVPIALVGQILPGIELPAITCGLIAIASGDRGELLELLERRRFSQTKKDAAELEAIVLYAAWRGGAPAARIIPEARRLSVRSMTAEGFALLATIAAAIDDENLAAATKHIATYAKEYAKQAAADERAMTAKVADVIAALPAEVETSLGGFTVRAGKQIGRNDPCPCGSGLKYKKCCADKPAAAPSPVPGLSWDEFLAGDRMTVEHVDELELRDLARVDVARLGDKPRVAALRRFTTAHAWDHAERVVELAGDPDLREELVLALFDAEEVARARLHVAKLPDAMAASYAIDMVDDPAKAWTTLVAECERALRSGDKVPDIELAYSLLRTAPAVGIYAARACIGTLHVDDPDLLLEAVEDARDKLNLPPTDPAWAVLDELTDKDQPEDDDSAKLRTSLQESSARADQLERTLAAMRSELDDARTKPAAALARTPEAERPSGLEHKVRELEALIREGNAERRELRDKLRAADDKKPDEGHRARRAEAPPDADDTETEAVDQGTRGIALPRFDRRFTDALDDVPAQVAAEAMRTIGTLAAGDGFAWRAVKQAKDMTRQVLMARVGIHHRMIFRVEAGAMDVIDLVTREQLLTTLKRIRKTGA